MQYMLDKYHLVAEIDTKACSIPEDQKVAIQEGLNRIGAAVEDLGESHLAVTVVSHPRSDVFHAQAKLKVPGQSIITGARHADFHTAWSHCLARVLRRLHAYRIAPNEEAIKIAKNKREMSDNVIAPVEVDDGPLGDAIIRDDYRAFRHALFGIEERVRKRVGRWVQRYPDVQARIGTTFEIADIVEEVFIDAFESYAHRPSNVPFGDWLESLIDPAVKAFQEDPTGEAVAARYSQSAADIPP